MEGILQYESVCIRYGDREVVHRVSFAVQPGQVLAIVGESGCGKSTLLKAAAGLTAPDCRVEGQIFFQGKPLLDLPKRQRLALLGSGLGMVFQEAGASLCPVRTVGAQVAESLAAAQGLSRREAKRRALALFARLDLPGPEGLWRAYPFQLSGGMQQRVVIAMALLLKPRVLLADEPTSALDTLARQQVLAELRRREDAALVLVTHDFGVAAALADRILVLDAGRTAEEGPAAELLAHPRSEAARRLLAAVPRLKGGRPV